MSDDKNNTAKHIGNHVHDRDRLRGHLPLVGQPSSQPQRNVMVASAPEELRTENLVVTGRVGGVSANILIDTGAEVNVIGAPLIEKLQVSSANCKPDRVVVTGAQSAHELKTLGVVDQVVIFAGKRTVFKRSLEFVATPDYNGDAVIGLPTLKKWGITISADLSGSLVTFRDWPGEA